ncbi:PREDICTED: uncharacterized protein LOC109125902 [Camelina sativa]|uniref:Uncharacterized protein LOC109125902 n=1 Tax=Camelina sativa TaxID=90675 RepID=A0ABM1QBU7_CAMSA|nr:PREDICTED: uncharacterized protein LOC109125902 [Camelina sativa]
MGDHESSVVPGSTGVIVAQSDVNTAISPYTLSSSDNPGVMITSVLLTEDNYIQWSEEMLNALQAKRKTGFISRTIPMPSSDSPDLENWKTVNSMIIGWIRSSIECKLKSIVTFVSSAHGKSCNIVSLLVTRLCNLWDELKNYRVSPICSCGVTLSTIVEERDEEKLHQFVMGLDDSRFGGLCTTLISMDPLPTLVVAYSKVIREEQRLSSARLQQNHESVGFLARSDNRDQSSRGDAYLLRTDHNGSLLGKGRSCTHCGRTGHEQKDFWQLVGFPDWWTDRERGTSGGRGSPGRGRRVRGSMVSSGGRGRGQPVTAHATSSNSSVFPAFTSEQLKVLTQMIHEKSGNGGSDKLSRKLEFGDIILDTWASHHMTRKLSLLHNVVSIPTCSVGFADGSKTFAMSDRFSRTLIGSGEEHDGVYYLTDVASMKIHAATVSLDKALWHPSFSVLSSLHLFSQSSSSVGSDSAIWTYLLLEKSKVRNVLTNFITYTERQFGKRVKTVRSDNGTEFMCLSAYFREKGIVHQTSCVGTPQQNGRVERKHIHILNVSRALLFQAKLPIKFWGESVLTAAYLINHTPSSIHKGYTPYELLYGCKPDYSQLRVFGCACYTHRITRDKDKFGERSRSCVFVIYPFGKKGWKIYDMERNEFVVSRDVVFCEGSFPNSAAQDSFSIASSVPLLDDD